MIREIELMRKTGLILGKVGTGLGLVLPIYLLVFLIWKCEVAFGSHAFLGGFLPNFGLGSSAMLAILLVSQLFFVLPGVLGIVYERKSSKVGGILLIVAGVGFALTGVLSYWVATSFLLATSILLLLQRRKILRSD